VHSEAVDRQGNHSSDIGGPAKSNQGLHETFAPTALFGSRSRGTGARVLRHLVARDTRWRRRRRDIVKG